MFSERSLPNIVDLRSFFLRKLIVGFKLEGDADSYLLSIFLWLETFLILDELLFEQKIILDAFRSQLFQPAARVGQHLR